MTAKKKPTQDQSNGIDERLREMFVDESVEAAAEKLAAKKPKEEPAQFLLKRVQKKYLNVDIVGISPLLVHAWSRKAIEAILAKHMKKAGKAREAKDPIKDYLDSRYQSTEGWDGIPAGGMKGCLVNACRVEQGLQMTLVKRVLFVVGHGRTATGTELIRINGEHRMHEACVRINKGADMDLRYRAEYPEWSATITIGYISNVFSTEQVLNLIELAGCCEGLCEHRPGSPHSNTGSNGMFEIKRVQE